MVILERWTVLCREWSCYGGGQFKEGRMVDIEVASLMEGEWFCYGAHFNAACLMEGEWSC